MKIISQILKKYKTLRMLSLLLLVKDYCELCCTKHLVLTNKVLVNLRIIFYFISNQCLNNSKWSDHKLFVRINEFDIISSFKVGDPYVESHVLNCFAFISNVSKKRRANQGTILQNLKFLQCFLKPNSFKLSM